MCEIIEKMPNVNFSKSKTPKFTSSPNHGGRHFHKCYVPFQKNLATPLIFSFALITNSRTWVAIYFGFHLIPENESAK